MILLTMITASRKLQGKTMKRETAHGFTHCRTAQKNRLKAQNRAVFPQRRAIASNF